MQITYTRNFQKAFKNLPSNIQDFAEDKEKLFRVNPFHSSLRTHKLMGKQKGYWSFSINYSYRILFKFTNNLTVEFLDIGTHQIYK